MFTKVFKEKAWVIQGVFIPDPSSFTLVKVLFVGVKEAVRAINATFLQNGKIELDDGATLCLYPKTHAKLCLKPIGGTPYVVGGIYHPDILAETVYGKSTAAIHAQALPLFKRLGLPLLEAWMPTLCAIAIQKGYAQQLHTLGVEGEAWRLSLPTQEVFAQSMEEHLPDLLALAQAVASQDPVAA